MRKDKRWDKRSHNSVKPQCNRKALSTVLYGYTVAVLQPVRRNLQATPRQENGRARIGGRKDERRT
jgi:hypothetical protein